MKRRVLIVSNPGEKGAENYCQGVNRDVRNYTEFFSSPLGGLWDSSELHSIVRPTVSKLKSVLADYEDVDYLKYVFTGHGYHSGDEDTTFLELQKDEDYDYRELLGIAPKTTVILDCCRKVYTEAITEQFMPKAVEEEKKLDHQKCRLYYNRKIEECDEGNIILFSCDISEYSYDSSSQGGYYSSNVLKAAKHWGVSKEIDLQNKYSTYSVAQAHNAAAQSVKSRSGNKQNPQIDKPRSEPYFPFAVLA